MSYTHSPTSMPITTSSWTTEILNNTPHPKSPVYSFLEFITQFPPAPAPEEQKNDASQTTLNRTGRNTIIPSYFHMHFRQLYSVPPSMPICLKLDSTPSPYHPIWKRWESKWKSPPIILNSIMLQDPQIETEFDDAFFCMEFNNSSARHHFKSRRI